MLIQILFAFLLPTILLAESTATVIGEVLRPKVLSSDEFNARVQNFWTADRLQAAKMLDVVVSGSTSKTLPINNTVPTGPQSSVPGSLPSGNGTSGKTISSNGRQVYTTGRVFWQIGTSGYSCSGAIVTSVSGDLISTAGHCVYDTTKQAWNINYNWVFVPAYYNGIAPYGIWPARRVIALQAWLQSTNYNYDLGFVALTTLNGQHIQSVLGSEGIGFNYPRLAFTYALGYPVNLYSGLYLQLCSGNTQNSKYTQNGYVGQALPCIMGGGCSGGPWLQNVVDATGIGYVTSVNSFTLSNVPNMINGPYFESVIKSMYNTATSM